MTNLRFARACAATSLGAEAIVAPVNDIPGVESLVITEARELNSGLVVIPDAFTVGHRAEITALAARYHVPADLLKSAA